MIQVNPIIFDIFMKPFEKLALHEKRKELISQAKGRALEIGAGTGVNFGYYNIENISELTVIDLKFNDIIKNHSLNKKLKINYIEVSAEKIPFPDNTFDVVVSTLIFCSVNNPMKALNEVYRVLKKGGKIYFIEHVLPEEKGYRKLVNNLNGLWKKVGKCNINRETLKNIKNANFKVVDYERFGKGIFIKGIALKE